MRFIKEFIVLILAAATIQCLSDTRIKIAVMDTGITFTKENSKYFCTTGHFDATGTGLRDNEGHGTNVSGLISKGIDPKTHCIIMIKFYNTATLTSKYSIDKTLLDSWEHLVDVHSSYVNLSLSGMSFDQDEYNTINLLLSRGTRIIVASGNDHINFNIIGCIVYPACYNFKKNFYVVGARDVSVGNIGGPVKYFAKGYEQTAWGITKTGTSQSTANFTSNLIRGLNGLR